MEDIEKGREDVNGLVQKEKDIRQAVEDAKRFRDHEREGGQTKSRIL